MRSLHEISASLALLAAASAVGCADAPELYWQGWGSATDALVPGDYNFDGKTDVAIFRASDHSWQIWLTGGSAYTQGPWGEPGDIAMATAKF